MNAVVLDSLSHHRAGMRAMFTAGQVLIDNGWLDWPAPQWDGHAVLVFDGDQCVAGVNWSIDAKQRRLGIDFAFCSPTHPAALVVCLAALRKRVRSEKFNEIGFSCHPDNGPMMKLARKLKLRAASVRFDAPAAALGLAK